MSPRITAASLLAAAALACVLDTALARSDPIADGSVAYGGVCQDTADCQVGKGLYCPQTGSSRTCRCDSTWDSGSGMCAPSDYGEDCFGGVCAAGLQCAVRGSSHQCECPAKHFWKNTLCIHGCEWKPDPSSSVGGPFSGCPEDMYCSEASTIRDRDECYDCPAGTRACPDYAADPTHCIRNESFDVTSCSTGGLNAYGGFETCQDQAKSIITIEAMSTENYTHPENCVPCTTWYQICIEAAKPSGTISHTCVKPDTNCIDTNTFGGNLSAHLNDVPSDFKQCQLVAPGVEAFFILKDGAGCSRDDPAYVYTDYNMAGLLSGTTVTCRPTNANDGSCSGTGNIGKECLWIVQAPGSVETCPGVQCTNASQCDDQTICTEDSCVDGTCVVTPVNGTCDDNDACTVDDVCFGGSCMSGWPVDCSNTQVANECQYAVCNSSSGACDILANKLTGELCNEHTLLDCEAQVCMNGQCIKMRDPLSPPSCCGFDSLTDAEKQQAVDNCPVCPCEYLQIGGFPALPWIPEAPCNATQCEAEPGCVYVSDATEAIFGSCLAVDANCVGKSCSDNDCVVELLANPTDPDLCFANTTIDKKNFDLNNTTPGPDEPPME